MKHKKGNRWYDRDPQLANYLNSFQHMNKKLRDELTTGIIEIVRENNSTLIDDHVLEFPLDLPQRRWYDKDPYLWLIFNGLRMADDTLLHSIKKYLKKKLTTLTPQT